MSAAPALQSAAPAAAVDPHSYNGQPDPHSSIAFPTPSSAHASEAPRPTAARDTPKTLDKGKQRRRSSLDLASSAPEQAEEGVQQQTISDPLENFTYGSFGTDSGPSSSYSSSFSPAQSSFRFPPSPPAVSGDGPDVGLRAGKGRQMPLPYARRPSSYTTSSHTRGLSSLGNLSDFDFFGPTSAASTAPTSIHSASPSNDKSWAGSPIRDTIGPPAPIVPFHIPEESTESTQSLRRTRAEEREPDFAPPEGLPSAHIPQCGPLPSVRSVPQPHLEDQQAGVPRPITNDAVHGAAEETLHAPMADAEERHTELGSRHSPALSMRTRIRRVVAARALSSRIVPSRVARTLSIPTDPHAVGAVARRDDRPDDALGFRRPRRTFSRFDSAPDLLNLPRSTRQSVSGTATPGRLDQARRVRVWAASDRISGARMGPYPSRGVERSVMTQGTHSAASSMYPSRPETPSPGEGRPASPFSALMWPRLERRLRAVTPAGHAGAISESMQAANPEPEMPSRASSFQAAPAELVHPAHGQAKRPALLRAALSTPPPSTALAATTHPELQDNSPADLFNNVLPRELRIEVLCMLFKMHIAEHEKDVVEGRYRGSQAREQKYVGASAAMRELVKLSFVSKTMMDLVLDGQLWRRLSFLALPELRKDGLLRIVDAAGSFISNLDLSGLNTMQSVDLKRLTRALCTCKSVEWQRRPARPEAAPVSSTALTHLNLQGLRMISTHSLNELLSRSPGLRSLCLKNLIAVKPESLEILAECCTHLEELDISRCPHLDGPSVAKWIREAPSGTKMRSLRAVGLKRVDPAFMRAISDKLARLETLDLGYAASLDDECLAALTAHEGPSSARKTLYFELTARQSGLFGDDVEYRRIFPSLRHLVLSSTAISDRGLASLAHGAIPALEVLEIANNERIRDRGLESLLESAPFIRRLDLEGLSHLTHNALLPLIPDHVFNGEQERRRRRRTDGVPAPGSQLTHLVMSKVKRVQSPIISALLKGCPRLRHLEADDTTVWDGVVLSFMKLVKNGQKEAAQSDTAAHREYLNIPVYLSMIDCNNLTRDFCNHLINSGSVRPRLGRRSFAYAGFGYGDLDSPSGGSAAAASKSLRENTRDMLDDECNEERFCMKTFDFWQALDRREREKRKNSVLSLSPAGRTDSRAVPRILGGPSANPAAHAARHAAPRSRRDHRSTANAAASVARIARQANAPRATETPSRWMRAFLAPFPVVGDHGDDDDDDEGVDALRTPCTIM